MKELLEKIKVYGEDNLTTEELLAILICGDKANRAYLKKAKKLIDDNKDLTGNLKFLMQISIEELMEQGLNLRQASRVKAVSGILKRLLYPIETSNLELNSSSDVARLFIPQLRFEKSELVKIVILSSKNLVLRISTLAIGTSSSAAISPKDILSEPVKMKAARIILVHNHPSRRFNT